MSGSPPNLALRGRVETLIRLIAPPLDLLLAVGERFSRLAGGDEPGYPLARLRAQGESAPRGLASYGAGQGARR